MKETCLILSLLALLLTAPASAQKTDAKNLDGIWLGTLDVGAIKLRLAVHLKTKDGKLGGTLDSLDQGAKDLPIETVEFKDKQLTLKMPKLQAVYEAKLNEGGTEFAGKFTQAGQTFPLTLKKVDKLPSVARPQEPKRPYPYRDEEVTYENKAGITFAGTLTLPKGDGPFPAVLLVTGSGPQDRDETVMNHRPFLIIADYLTRKGIAVLRVDDRGVGKTKGGDVNKSTTADFAEDALLGVAYLKGRKEINPAKIGILGHSEGGIVAPLAAAQSKDVAFIVLLAGTGLPGDELLYLQGRAILLSMGVKDEKQLARQKALQEAMFKIAKSEKDDAKAKAAILANVKEYADKLTDEEKKAVGDAAGSLEAQAKMVVSPWFRSFLAHDPRVALRKVHCPVLALCGELDVQVPPKENLPEIEKALKEAGNKDFTVKELPKLNHLFQTAKTGAITEYATIEETFAPSALELIAEWVLKRK